MSCKFILYFINIKQTTMLLQITGDHFCGSSSTDSNFYPAAIYSVQGMIDIETRNTSDKTSDKITLHVNDLTKEDINVEN